VIFTRVM